MLQETVDLILHPRWIAPVVPEGLQLENVSIAVQDGVIIDLLERHEMQVRYHGRTEVELPQHLLIPGLVNAHGHAAMTLLRGYADDYDLMNWLNDHIWPAESKWVSENFVRHGTDLACAEMIRSGTTCFSDMYFFPEAAASSVIQAGLRCQLAFPVLDFPSAWAKTGAEYIHKGTQLFDQYQAHPRIQIAFGPHAPYTVADGLLEQVATLANELDAAIQIHLHETGFEVAESLRIWGLRPIDRLCELNILGPRTQCVHMTQITEGDIQQLQKWNSHVIHCPESNLKLASGFCPVQRLLNAEINVALGTDGAASNNDLNLLSELRTAALLGKAVANDATALNAHTALRMATLNGAKALGLDDLIGSLEVGKQADMVAVDLSGLESTPLYQPVSQLVYATSGHRVTHSWVAGQCLLDNGDLTTLDCSEIIQRAQHWASQIEER